MKTKQILITILFTFAWAVSAQAKDLVNKSFSGLAVKGYDVVAFHTEGKAIKGDRDIVHKHGGAKYRFSTEANRAAFIDAPEKYLPAYGGYCAWGLAEKGKLFPVSIKTWQIVDGRLFLNYDKDVQRTFNEDVERFIELADQKWSERLAVAGKQ